MRKWSFHWWINYYDWNESLRAMRENFKIPSISNANKNIYVEKRWLLLLGKVLMILISIHYNYMFVDIRTCTYKFCLSFLWLLKYACLLFAKKKDKLFHFVFFFILFFHFSFHLAFLSDLFPATELTKLVPHIYKYTTHHIMPICIHKIS